MLTNLQQTVDNLMLWLREQARAAALNGGVVGISGGVDSAVVGALCARAFGPKALGLILPCESHSSDFFHAKQVVEAIGLAHRIVDLSPIYHQLLSLVNGAPENRSVNGNLKARLRMTTLYYYANDTNSLVVGTGNRTELTLGYFTKYGDGGVDLLPLGSLVKEEVYQLGRFLELPREILDKPPSAGLWPGQTDEEELGQPYSVLDQLVSTGFTGSPNDSRLQELQDKAEHKLRMPLIPSQGLAIRG